MSGLGGLNKSKHGVVVGLVQLQLPVVETPAQLAAQTQRICELVGKARRNQGSMDLVVFPEYALHGLSMSTAPELMVSLDGPEVAAFKQALASVAKPQPLVAPGEIIHSGRRNPTPMRRFEDTEMEDRPSPLSGTQYGDL